jgi:DNA-binding transcriptional LysR family regulator
MQWEDRIGRRIKFRNLHIALAVAQSGSMSKAAHALAVSQPVVSKGIAELEQELGVRLFERNRRGIEPTASGRALLSRGRAAFDEMKQGVKEIEFLNNPMAGELRIGSGQPLAQGIGVAIIDRLSRQYPRVTFHIVSGDAISTYQDVRERRVELGVTRLPGTDPEHVDLAQEALFDEPLVVVAGSKSRWVRNRKINLADLVNELWTWPSVGSIVDLLVIAAFRECGLEAPRPAVYTDSFNMRAKLAATNRFLAVVHASMLRFSVNDASIKLLPVELPRTTHRQIGIITLRNKPLSPLAQLFIQCAREVAKPLTRRK